MSSRVSRISVSSHCNDLGGKVWNPAIRWTRKYAVFVEIETCDGRVGLGECWCFDAAPDALIAYLRTEVVPHYIGLGLDDFAVVAEALTRRATLTARHGILATALSGIDIAMWDLRAQQASRPLWARINQHGRGVAPLYCSGGLYGQDKTTADLTDEMSGMAREGFRLSKMKVGALSIEADVARVKSVLAALSEDARLIIDGVYSYTSDEAQRLFDMLPVERIEAFQSPTKACDIAGMAALSRAGIAVMATEAEYRDELHRQLVEEARVAFLQTAPVACGGISRVLELGRLVAGTETRLSLEVSSSAVALMAACHLAAADDAIAHVEKHTVHRVFFDDLNLVRRPGDLFALPDRPGLGITLRHADVSAAFSFNSPVSVNGPQEAAE
ncbi:enolase C-terminal domain-like protein [Nitratireductor luteus]|uniref:enolase C-terminal domain-like protein n=1 Tax=Nitratireductor luteus TaxID=2976980 RepID=UPI00223EBD45|nr:enolase C-terminal domain-like protein [Nitratireductor luteus]